MNEINGVKKKLLRERCKKWLDKNVKLPWCYKSNWLKGKNEINKNMKEKRN